MLTEKSQSSVKELELLLKDFPKKKKKLYGVQFKKGVSGNLEGRPKGSVSAKTFSKTFDKAINKIAQSGKIKLDDPEVELVTKGIIEALKGNYQFWKDIMDRLYGK